MDQQQQESILRAAGREDSARMRYVVIEKMLGVVAINVHILGCVTIWLTVVYVLAHFERAFAKDTRNTKQSHNNCGSVYHTNDHTGHLKGNQ